MPELRPIAHATDGGRVAVYIGAAWQDLPLAKALNLRDQLNRAIDELRDQAAAAADACQPEPERFAAQLRRWRDGLRSEPPMPELAVTRADELERLALEAIASENPHA